MQRNHIKTNRTSNQTVDRLALVLYLNTQQTFEVANSLITNKTRKKTIRNSMNEFYLLK